MPSARTVARAGPAGGDDVRLLATLADELDAVLGDEQLSA